MKWIIILLFFVATSCGYKVETSIEYNANDNKYEVNTLVWDNSFRPNIVGSKYNWKVGEYSDTRVTLEQLDSTVKAHEDFAKIVILNMKMADSALATH